MVVGDAVDAYGTMAFGTPTTPFGYSSQYTDATTGLVNDRARWYKPQAGGFLTRDPLTAITGQPYAYANDDPVNESDPLGLWGWNPIKDVTQGWNDTGGKAVHFVDHKVAIGEIAVGVVVVAGVTVATVATGRLADAVAIGAAGAAEEVASAGAGESLVGLFGLTFPLGPTIALAPVAFVGPGALALTGYGGYELYSQLSGGSATPKCGQQ
jgi:RHS repeat-associated protein